MQKLRPVALLIAGALSCTAQQEEAGGGITTADTVAAPLAPPLQGRRSDGKEFDLTELRGDRVVLIFYRSASCGLCIQQLDNLARDMEAYEILKTRVVAITTDTPETNRQIIEEHNLDFPIISVDRTTLANWGVWEPGERNPKPAAFILGEGGEILYHQIGQTAADRTSDATLVFTLRSLDSLPKSRRN